MSRTRRTGINTLALQRTRASQFQIPNELNRQLIRDRDINQLAIEAHTGS